MTCGFPHSGSVMPKEALFHDAIMVIADDKCKPCRAELDDGNAK